jgi:hypothetical protein
MSARRSTMGLNSVSLMRGTQLRSTHYEYVGSPLGLRLGDPFGNRSTGGSGVESGLPPSDVTGYPAAIRSRATTSRSRATTSRSRATTSSVCGFGRGLDEPSVMATESALGGGPNDETGADKTTP